MREDRERRADHQDRHAQEHVQHPAGRREDAGLALARQEARHHEEHPEVDHVQHEAERDRRGRKDERPPALPVHPRAGHACAPQRQQRDPQRRDAARDLHREERRERAARDDEREDPEHDHDLTAHLRAGHPAEAEMRAQRQRERDGRVRDHQPDAGQQRAQDHVLPVSGHGDEGARKDHPDRGHQEPDAEDVAHEQPLGARGRGEDVLALPDDLRPASVNPPTIAMIAVTSRSGRSRPRRDSARAPPRSPR